MTIEQLASLGEIIAAAGVIASLIYVARQLGQTNTTMRVNAASERMERDFDIVLPVIESREVAELWFKGAGQFYSLDEVDQQRLLFFERRAIMLWHHQYQLRQQDLMPDASWTESLWIIQNLGRRQAIREAWKQFGNGFEAPFVAFVEEQFAIGDELAN
jgi:hypothetical protein